MAILTAGLGAAACSGEAGEAIHDTISDGTSGGSTGTGGSATTPASTSSTGGTYTAPTATGGTAAPTATGGTAAPTTTSTGGTTVTASGTAPAASAPTPTAAPASGASAAAAPAAAPTGTIIPLYTTPSDPSWAAVAAAKAAHPAVTVVAVVNPSNGPGSAATPDYTAGIARLTAAGVKVLGYVHTSYGGRPATQIETEIDDWHAWYPGVTGIFFDEMAHDAGNEGYYRSLTAYAKGHGGDFTVGNPGTDTTATYVGTTDVILIYESSGVPAIAALGGWHTSVDRHNFGVIPYGVPSLDSAFVSAAKAYVGYIYLQSDTLPNPWDSVTPYLNDLLAALD